jgi:hypothetical protein
MHILVECLALVYISRNTAARAINMSMVYAAVPDVPHIKTEVVTFVTGRWEILKFCNAESYQKRFLSLALIHIYQCTCIFSLFNQAIDTFCFSFLDTCCSVELRLENHFYNSRR